MPAHKQQSSSLEIPKFLYPEEVELLLEQPRKHLYSGLRNYWMMRIMVNYGLRISEATSLKWRHIRYGHDLIHVHDGKGNKDRQLPLAEEDKQGLIEYADELDQKFDFDLELVFPTKNNTEPSRQYVWSAMKRYQEQAGLKRIDIGPHTLRHTFAVNYYRKESDLLGLQKLLGHSSLSTVLRYAKVMDEDLSDRFKTFRSEAGFE